MAELSRVDIAIDHAVSEISKADAAIDQVREEYLALTVASPQDKAGYQSAETALKRVVRMRTTLEKKRKELKADSVRYGKAVDAEARRIRELLEPIENHLKEQCDIVRLEEARQKVAAENARRDQVNQWVEELSGYGWPVDLPALQRMTEEEYAFVRLSAKRQYEKQAAERAELEALRAEKAAREPVDVVNPFEHAKRQYEKQTAERAELDRAITETLTTIVRLVESTQVPAQRSRILEVLGGCADQLRGLFK